MFHVNLQKCFPVTELGISPYVRLIRTGIQKKFTVLGEGRSRDASLPCSCSNFLMLVKFS